MVKTITKITKAFFKSIVSTIKHDGIEHAGYMSFLLMLSIFPFLVFFVAIIGTLSNTAGFPVVATLTSAIIDSPWAGFINSLKPRIIEISNLPPQNFLTIAILSAVWTASSIFEAIRTTLNRAYNINNPPSYILRRLFSIFEFMVVTMIIFIAILILVIMPIVWRFLEDHINYIPNLHNIFIILTDDSKLLRSIILYIFGTVFVSYIYYSLPNRKQRLFPVLPGVFTVLICWSIFSNTFKYYISYFPQINMIYGSIAGIIISLLYFYFCSLILIFGAEFNYALEISLKKGKNV